MAPSRTIAREPPAADNMVTHTSPSRRSCAVNAARTAGVLLPALLALSACSTYYDLTLRPREGGKPYVGTAHELTPGQAAVSIEIGEKTYSGTWTQMAPERSTTYVGASAWGWWDWGPSSAGNRAAGESIAKALLQASDGSAMRCDFFGPTVGHGTGTCVDDKGRTFDVQFRSRNSK